MKIQRWLQNAMLRDWHERLTVALTGLLPLQFVIWIQREEGLWLPETVEIVKLTLLATIVIEVMLYKRLLSYCRLPS